MNKEKLRVWLTAIFILLLIVLSAYVSSGQDFKVTLKDPTLTVQPANGYTVEGTFETNTKKYVEVQPDYSQLTYEYNDVLETYEKVYTNKPNYNTVKAYKQVVKDIGYSDEMNQAIEEVKKDKEKFDKILKELTSK